MKNRDLRRFPFNRPIEITNGIYTHIITKFLCEPDEYRDYPMIMYQIRIKGQSVFTESFAVFEGSKKDDEYPYIEYPIMTYSASMGGFSFSGEFYFPWSFSEDREFKIVTENNLGTYLKKQFGTAKNVCDAS